MPGRESADRCAARESRGSRPHDDRSSGREARSGLQTRVHTSYPHGSRSRRSPNMLSLDTQPRPGAERPDSGCTDTHGHPAPFWPKGLVGPVDKPLAPTAPVLGLVKITSRRKGAKMPSYQGSSPAENHTLHLHPLFPWQETSPARGPCQKRGWPPQDGVCTYKCCRYLPRFIL